MTSAEEEYRSLATDYEWLVPQGPVEAEAVLDRHGHRLAAFVDPKILDCACGVGADAVALARRGYRVWGSDGSEAMLAKARQRITEAGLELPLEVCRWQDLPGCFEERFDFMLCLGNSVSHLQGDDMIEAFRGMAAVLGPGGLLVVNARNWEKLRREQPPLTFPEQVLQRDGRRCIPLYVWSYAADWDGLHRVDIVFLFETDGRLKGRRHELTFWPFRLGDLRDRLAAGGLRVVDDTYRPEADWYEVVAERP